MIDDDAGRLERREARLELAIAQNHTLLRALTTHQLPCLTHSEGTMISVILSIPCAMWHLSWKP